MKTAGWRAYRPIYLAVFTALAITCILIVLSRWRSSERIEKSRYQATFSNPNEWLALGGSWTQRYSEVASTAEDRGAKLIWEFEHRADYQVEADLQIDDPHGDAGLILRSSDEEEGVDAYRGYLARIRPSEGLIEFGRADFGWQPLATEHFSAPVRAAEWLHVRVMAVGCEFAFAVTFADGSSASTLANDASCLVSGRLGLRSSLTSARWRNLTIQAANRQDLAAFEAAIAQSPASPTPDDPDLDPSPASLEHFLAAMRRDALNHVFPKHFRYITDYGGPPGRLPDVTIVGTIVSTPPLLIIQDFTGSIMVADYESQTALKLGDTVEARATFVREGLGRHLEAAKIRALWSDTPVAPLAVTASQFTDGSYRGRTISVEGTLVSATSKPGGYELVLTDQNYEFLAIGPTDLRIDLLRLEAGSRLRLRGAATVADKFTKKIYPFAVIADRVEVVSGPPWWSTRHLIWLGAALVAVFASILLSLHFLQRWRMQSILQEREHLALEMHDTLAQSFTGIGYQLQAASQERRGEAHVQAHILSALQMVKLSHKEASRTISSLRPQYRDSAAIVDSLKEGAERLSDGGLRIDDSLSGPNLALPLAITDAFFRIGQEAISNAIQHGRCEVLTIQLTITRKRACLTVADDGSGFDVESVREGLGIEGMKSRATTAKVDFEIHSSPEHGTTVSVRARHSRTNEWLRAMLIRLKEI